jgi:hypothetical protein
MSDISDIQYANLSEFAYKSPEDRANVVGLHLGRNYKRWFAVENNGEVAVVFRGTDPWSGEDLYTDVQLAIGNIRDTSYYQSAREFVQEIQSSFPDKKITLTGHSLGGTIAAELGEALDLPSVSFNPGSSPFQRPHYGEKQVIYHSVFDPISFLSRGETVYTKRGGDHGLAEYLTYDPFY